VTKSTTMTGAGDASAYEALRAHILTGATSGSHDGLVVLLRQGVTAWMERRSACSVPLPPATRTAAPFTGNEIQSAIVRVLASMVLVGQMEVRV